jgi:hypothetical protein
MHVCIDDGRLSIGVCCSTCACKDNIRCNGKVRWMLCGYNVMKVLGWWANDGNKRRGSSLELVQI